MEDVFTIECPKCEGTFEATFDTVIVDSEDIFISCPFCNYKQEV
jgi:hypothetical protein